MLLDLSAEHPEISREGDEISDQQSSNMLPTVRTQRLSGSNSAAGDPLSIHDVHQRADRRSRHLAAQEDEERLPLSSMNLHGSATNSASSWPSEKGGRLEGRRYAHGGPSETVEVPRALPTSSVQMVRALDTPGMQDGMEDTINDRPRRIRYEVDGGVRLAGGGVDGHLEDDGEGTESGTSLTLPPPYFSLSRS